MRPNSSRTTEADRKNYNDRVNSQTMKQNEAVIEGYYSAKPSAPPFSSSDYWITVQTVEANGVDAPRQVLCQ